MRSKKLLPFYVLITLLVAGFMGFYIFLKMDPSNQRFAQPPEKLTPIAEFNHESRIHDVAFSPTDASLIAGADADKTIKLWNLANTEAPQAILKGHIGPVISIAFSPNGRLLVSASLYSRVVLWDVLSATKINSLETPATVVAISPDGHYLATASRHLKLWDIRNPKEITEVETLPHDKSVLLWTVDFSPDGKWLACGDGNGNLNVWDLQGQKLIQSVKADTEEILSVQFSADNRFFASAGPYGHTLWDIPEWKPHGKILGEEIGADFAFSSDSTMYAITDYNKVILRALESGIPIASLPETHAALEAIAFSSDSSTLACGGKDQMLRLWNTSEQQLAKIDTDQRDVVRLIYFLSKEHPPQRRIVTKLDRLVKQAQRFYASQMNNHGFGRKTFTFETDARRKAKVYLFKAQHPDNYYSEDTIKKIETEIAEHFDPSKNILLIVVDIRSGIFYRKDSTISGVGGLTLSLYNNELDRALHAGNALISAVSSDLEWDTIAHELGHTFGLAHDFRGRNRRIMSYASGRYELSKCAAEWLNKNRFFNPNQPFFDKPATIEMHPLPTLPNATPIQIQFDVTDEDGIHQVQLVVPTTPRDPVTYEGSKLHSCQSLNGVEKATVTFELPKLPVKKIELQMMDLHGNIVWREFDLSKDSAQPSEKP